MGQKNGSVADLLSGIPRSQSLFLMTFTGFAVVAFLSVVFRNVGLNPLVFADEWTYSSSARLMDLADSVIPSYLFLLLFKGTSSCGVAFLECARLINALLLVGAMPFIYLVARSYAGRGLSLFVAWLSVLGPFNVYTAYFMPETLYFLGFWVFAWYVLVVGERLKPWAFGGGSGAILGLMMAVKFHAVFLLAALFAYIFVYALLGRGRLAWISALQILIAALIAAFVTRFAFGYLIAGPAGLSLTGNFYGGLADSALSVGMLFSLIKPAFGLLASHALALCLLFTMPVAILIARLWAAVRRSEESTVFEQLPLSLFTLAVLAALLSSTVLFTALVAGQGPYETLSRLHMRYYDFVLPLFYMLVVAQFKQAGRAGWLSIVVGGAVAGLAGLALVSAEQRFTPSIVDNPILYGFMADPQVSVFLSVLGIFSVVVWMFRQRWGAGIFLVLFLPLSVMSSGFYLGKELRVRLSADVYDSSARLTKLYLGEAVSGLLVASSVPAANFRALFHIDDRRASFLHLEPAAALTKELIPAGTRWVLLIGQHELQVPVLFQIDAGDYRLVKVSADDTLHFNRPSWPGSLSEVHGLSSPEQFGRWSNGEKVALQLVGSLSGTVRLTLTASAFGPNIGQPFTLRLGEQEQHFTLQGANEEVSLLFALTESAQKIEIQVPQPTSPKMLGLSDDDRLLGIAMHKLQIQQVE